MPTLAQKALARLRGRSATVAGLLAARRTDSLGRWAELVQASAAGREVDVGELEQLGITLRLTDVAGCFDADVAAVLARAEAAEEVKREQAIHSETLAAAEKAGKKIAQIQAELRTLLAQAEAPIGTSAGVAYAKRRLTEAEDRAPRIYGREILERARFDNDPPVDDAAVEQFALGMNQPPAGIGAAAALGEAEFELEGEAK